MISHGATQGYWVPFGSGGAFAFVFVVVDCLVVVVIPLAVVVVDLGLEVGFEPAPPVAFVLPVVLDLGASVAPLTVAVGPAGGAR